MRNITANKLREFGRHRGPLYEALTRGKNAAYARFKLAGPMGADVGVMPPGEEQSHGTNRVQYARRDPGSEPQGQDPDMPQWLWDLASYDSLAPGRADGSYGQETIG